MDAVAPSRVAYYTGAASLAAPSSSGVRRDQISVIISLIYNFLEGNSDAEYQVRYQARFRYRA